MRSFLLICTFIIAASAVQDMSTIFNPSNGHYYQFVIPDAPMNFSQMSAIAGARYRNGQQGYLVTVTDANEEAFLHDYIYSTYPYFTDFPVIWMDAKIINNQWVWFTPLRQSAYFYDIGTKYCNLYCHFNKTTFAANETCMQLHLNTTAGPPAGSWRAVTCNMLVGALIIEYDASSSCSAGYTFNSTSGWCVDVDECKSASTRCPAGYHCTNTYGSYFCEDNDECAANRTICGSGYNCTNTNGSYRCDDIDECKMNMCGSGYTCNNTVGNYTCTDINECAMNSSICGAGYTCTNTVGSYNCTDVDECAMNSTICGAGYKCQNTPGSYKCGVVAYMIRSVLLNLYIEPKSIDGQFRLSVKPMRTSNITYQLWQFTAPAFVTNLGSGGVFDIDGAVYIEGRRALCYPAKQLSEADNQQWMYNSTTKMFTSKVAPLALDIWDAGRTSDELVVYAPGSTDPATRQQWEITEVDYFSS